jgi:hypothetical protein
VPLLNVPVLPAQDRAHASDNLFDAEGLGDVVVAPDGEPTYRVLRGVTGSQEEEEDASSVASHIPNKF